MSRVDLLLAGARDCLSQNLTYPADVAMAIRRIEEARAVHAELHAAARASLDARDLADQLSADDRLRAALAACEPTDTDHNREAVDGLCVEENDDER
ncbi:hypothetical protein JY460_06035 [Stenotrophomonas maltophilia]|nr:hypothetical protein [Stenotrophomonas maltophilia]